MSSYVLEVHAKRSYVKQKNILSPFCVLLQKKISFFFCLGLGKKNSELIAQTEYANVLSHGKMYMVVSCVYTCNYICIHWLSMCHSISYSNSHIHAWLNGNIRNTCTKHDLADYEGIYAVFYFSKNCTILYMDCLAFKISTIIQETIIKKFYIVQWCFLNAVDVYFCVDYFLIDWS